MSPKKGFKEKAHELFPWEEEEKKRKPERMDSIPPGTSLKAKVRSKPAIAGQEYLDLYLMVKEKERLEKFGKVMGKIQLGISKSWKDVREAVIKGEKNLPSVEEVQGIKGEAKKASEEEKPKREMPKKMKKVDWHF